jgi:SAM-dependent methyltransferase
MEINTKDLSPEKSQINNNQDLFLKKWVRASIYPILNWISTVWLSSRYQSDEFIPDFWLWGQRGNDYARLRKRVDRYLRLSDATIFIAGCGSGKDLPSWLQYCPKKIIGVDLFNYKASWQQIKNYADEVCAKTCINFFQGNLENLRDFKDSSFDIVASDAVFEHLQNMNDVLRELKRILRPGGIIYATFGPMWYSWGGDHYSGFDKLEAGYNHLLLEREELDRYRNVGISTNHSENDGRTWINENLFSYLKPKQYIELLDEAGFHRLEWGVIVEPRALAYKAKYRKNWNILSKNYAELDLILTGMTIIFQKPI